MLKQIPGSGDWIDPRNITSVDARDGDRTSGPRTICVCDGIHRTIYCDSYDEAVLVRDQIAAMANEAQSDATPASDEG